MRLDLDGGAVAGVGQFPEQREALAGLVEKHPQDLDRAVRADLLAQLGDDRAVDQLVLGAGLL